jgi:hypothetical protein
LRKNGSVHELGATAKQESSSAGSSNGVASLLALLRRFVARCKILGRIGPADKERRRDQDGDQRNALSASLNHVDV